MKGDALAVGRLRRARLGSIRFAVRAYHDKSYGYREPRRLVLPDCMYSPSNLGDAVTICSHR